MSVVGWSPQRFAVVEDSVGVQWGVVDTVLNFRVVTLWWRDGHVAWRFTPRAEPEAYTADETAELFGLLHNRAINLRRQGGMPSGDGGGGLRDAPLLAEAV